jgi:leucyl/phenylalanyl-tRNA--protein transferase
MNNDSEEKDRLKLTTNLLRHAYSQGFFPMPDPDTEEILWYHPDERAVIPLQDFHVSRSLRRTIKKVPFRVSFNENFPGVVNACANRPDTWINHEIKQIYNQLHQEGDAHSVEVWLDEQLVGGLYGVSLGGAFFAESKFHTATDASKVALYNLVERMKKQGMQLLEVQFMTDHLQTLGATPIDRDEYLGRLAAALRLPVRFW